MAEMNGGGWSEEKEGQLVKLLQRLAGAREELEEDVLRARLRELSGEKIDGGLSTWLTWFLEKHLGIEHVLKLLAGYEEPRNEDESSPALTEEAVFTHPEYNWCALEKVKNRDDMLKLRFLYLDLETPLRISDDGPFSFRRLTGLSANELEFFAARPITETIFSDDAGVNHLRVLKDYGKLMMMPALPSSTQRAGAIIYAASIARALVKFDTKITSLTYKQLAESMQGLLSRPYITEAYRELFRAAVEKCS